MKQRITPRYETIWITGATSGIGREMAVRLAAAGHTIIASGRRRDLLEQLAGDSITPVVFDVTQANQIDAVREQIQSISPFLDRVIFSAGHCEYLDFPEPDWTMIDRVMAVNFSGAVNSTRVALPLLRKSPGRPHIIGIASQVIRAPFPKAEAYGASKAALQYFLESLRIDLAGEGIDVTVVQPGFVDTPMTRRNDFPMPFLMPADRAAQKIIAGIWRRPRQFSFPHRLAALLKLSRLFPRQWQKAVAPANETDA